MVGVWTIEINGVSKEYKELSFNRKLVLNNSTEFSAKIKYSSGIHFMDVVVLKRDGTAEWKGYIEKLNPYWDASGHYYNISGRDATMILWKKYNDDYTNFAQKTAGMFGTVDPMQLLHFILHTPKSEIGVDYPYNKEGWGLDFCRTIDVERVDAKYANSNDSVYMLGNPQWVFARERGYGWSNTGRNELINVDKTLNNISLSDWTPQGGGLSPYINNNTLVQPIGYTNFIQYTKNTGIATPITNTSITCDIPQYILTGKTVNAITVTIVSKFVMTSGGYNSPEDGISIAITSKSQGKPIVFATIKPTYTSVPFGPWNVNVFDVTSYITDKNDLADPDLAIVISTVGDWYNWGYLSYVDIGYVHLNVLTSEANNSYQTEDDSFEIAFKPELLTPAGTKLDQENTPTAIDRNGIVGEYLLNEGSGTIIYDSSGTNVNASITGANIQWAVGPNSDLVQFLDGSDATSYINCGNSFTWLTGHNEMSIDCWTSITSLDPAGNRYIINKPNQCILRVNSLGGIVWGLNLTNTWVTKTTVDDVVIQNGRTHIQAVYDGYSMNIYVNNELIFSELVSGYLTVDGTAATYLRFGPMYGYLSDVFIYNRAIYPTITALYVECRANTNNYPRHLAVEYLDGSSAPWVVIPNTSPTAAELANGSNFYTNPDIIVSFPPIYTQKVRLRITADYASAPWGISQIYVYKKEDIKYRPYLDSTESASDPSLVYPHRQTDDPTVYTYAGGPYIKAFSDETTTSTKQIGPLNMSRQRMLDAINYIVGLCSDTTVGDNNTVGFAPFEWWLEFDDDNTFHIKNQKGTDKSASIVFETAVNIGECDYQQFIDDTVQNIYMVGTGEQKKLQDTSLWVRSVNATGFATNLQPLADAEKTVRTFYEDAVQDKTIIIDDSNYPAVGNIIGCANLTINAMPRVQITLKLNKDEFTSMAYDVGDIVTVTDPLNGIGPLDLAGGKYRIQNIEKTIQADSGEVVSITLGYPNYKFEDELQTMYRNLKSLAIVGTFNSDWTAEGTDKKLLDARLVSKSSQYSQDAQNDKMAQSIPYNSTLWTTAVTHFKSTPVTSNAIDSHFMWGNNDWFGMSSTTGKTNALLLTAILLGNVVNYYDPNTSAVVQGCDASNIQMTWNPHFVMDVKCCDGAYSDMAGASWTYEHWRRGNGHLVVSEATSTTPYSGDYCRIGMADQYGNGFWFMFVKTSDDSGVTTPALFDVFVQWKLIDGTTNFDVATFNYENLAVGSGIDSPNGSYIKTITANTRWKIELVSQSDPDFIATNTPNVKFNLYEYKNVLTTTNEGLQLSYTQLTYPSLGIIVNSAIQAMILKPLECEFYNLPQSAPSGGQFSSAINFYKWNTDWTVKQVEVGEI